jgi:hypothetical protein
LQRTAGGFMCKKWGFLMGFSGRLTRHRNRSKYFTFAQGAKRKVALLLPCVQQARDRGDHGSGEGRRRRPEGLGAREDGAGCRGEEGDREGGLTGGIDEERRPEFKEGQTSSWPWWPARCPADWGAPADLRRRETAKEAWLDVAELPVVSASTRSQRPRRRRRRRRSGRRRAAAEARVAG